MTEFEADYLDGFHPVSHPVCIRVDADGYTSIQGENIDYRCQWQDIQISHPLGTTARRLTLPNKAQCETLDHESIRKLEQQFGRDMLGHLLHRLESRWHYVVIASLVVVAFTTGMIIYGIPVLAKGVAYSLPEGIDTSLSKGTLKLLDEYVLEPSELQKPRQQTLQNQFAEVTRQAGDSHDYQLMFRRGVGPNAFALPSGDIIVTDELIDVAEHDDEIVAILAHEVGHVVNRHGLRSVLQSSAVALLLTAITGDISTASGFAAAMPVILLETRYSRKFEHEADQYALDYMRQQSIDPQHFANILQRITGDDFTEKKSAFSYFSTHPLTSDRIKRFVEVNGTANK